MKTTKVPLVTKWWTVIRRMSSGEIGIESIGPVKEFKDERPYAMMPWSHYLAVIRIVRNAADMPCKCVAVNLNNCLSCQARKVLKGKRK